MATVNLGAFGINSRPLRSDSADRHLSSAKNLHGSLQTVYRFTGLPQQHRVIRNSVFPLVAKAMKFIEPKPESASSPNRLISQTWFTTTSKLRVKVVGAFESNKGAMSPATEIGVAVFILKDDKILFGCRRSLSVGGYTYMLPGGHLEFGETFEECAAREVKEETGLEIKNAEVLTVTNDRFSDTKHVVAIYMRAHLSDPNQTPTNIEPTMCEGWNWYDLKNLPEPMFGPLREILQGDLKIFPSDL